MYCIFIMMNPIEVLQKYKMYTTRPLAVLLDTYVISRLWGNLWIILFSFTILHFISSFLLYKVLEKNKIRTGSVLVIIFTLIPLCNDASYWIAASSRIVVGLFFAILSFYLYMKYIEGMQDRKKNTSIYLIGFAITNLISLGFYEQIIAFSFIGILLLMAVNFKRQKNKWINIIPFFNILIVVVYYIAFSNTGNVASRGQIIKEHYIQHSVSVLNRIGELIIYSPASIVKHGLINGTQLLIADRAIVFTLIAVLISIVLGVQYSKEKVSDSWRSSVIKLILGVFLVFVPFAPFFVLQSIWIVYRNAFISLIGVGLIIESLASIIFMRWDIRSLRGIVAGIVVFIFLVGNVAELNDYRSVSKIDNEIVTNISETLEKEKGQDWYDREIIVFNTKPLYINPTSKHFSNSTAADWALCGAMGSILRKQNLGGFHPVTDGKNIKISTEIIKMSVLIGLDDNKKAYILEGVWKTDKQLELRLENGDVFGVVNISEDESILLKVESRL